MKLLPGQYTFQANVYDPSNHNFIIDRWPLQFLPKLFHVVIQTDKELYKGGNLMRFRLFAFDADTRLIDISSDSTTISIIDPNNITMHNITNFDFSKGRYSDEFHFTEFAANGLWRIRVHIDDQVRRKLFVLETEIIIKFFSKRFLRKPLM
jgi:uncharacterized protein YfaS (alpha-2-macroglobulin family)